MVKTRLSNGISRREFLKTLSVCAAGIALPVSFTSIWESDDWPLLDFYTLPAKTREILSLVPRLIIGMDGYLALEGSDNYLAGRIPTAQTQWNKERSSPRDRLDRRLRWGIVLHWYGDRENFDRSLRGYLRGFDSLRTVDDYITRTSAHFLVGNQPVDINSDPQKSEISILQTQVPDSDGTPFLASHLMPLDHLAHKNQKQYFVRALYTLSNQGLGPYTILQDFFDGPQSDPNYRTIAIENCGFDFEHAEHAPSSQQIANVIGLVWAIMKRYHIFATDIFGHNEIQLGKADPGKKFTALIRILIAVKSLLEGEWDMLQLVFGPFACNTLDLRSVVERYFNFVRDYLVLVGSKLDVYEWEANSKYWFIWRHLSSSKLDLKPFDTLVPPILSTDLRIERAFLQPENHSGVDIYQFKQGAHRQRTLPAIAQLPADGICLFTGKGDECLPGSTAIFRHFQPDGAQILTIFGGLSQVGDLQNGQTYPQGYRVGQAEAPKAYLDSLLHYAVAYGATWDADFQHNTHMPLNAGPRWINERYIDPVKIYGPGGSLVVRS